MSPSSKTLSPIGRQFLKRLKDHANPERATFDQGYHKSARTHWGVNVPSCVAVVREFAKTREESDLIGLAEELWATEIFDAKIAATKILALPKVKPSPALWKIVKRYLRDVDGWALEDNLARTGWKCIAKDEGFLDEVESWTRHKNFWMRRAALIFTLPYAKPGKDPIRMLGWAGSYAKDPEWFIQKAIGWWLRDLGEHDPERVINFLAEHWASLKPVAKKEATRKLEKKWTDRLNARLNPRR